MKVLSYLPSFKGFYGSIFEDFDTQTEVESINEIRREKGLDDINDGDVDWCWNEYYNQCAKSVTNVVCDLLKSDGYVSDIKYMSIVSPKFYNFENDSILCEIEISDTNHEKIMAYIDENYNDFRKYIRDRFTSRSGFISFYTNDVDEWRETAKNISDANQIEVQHILDFICENEGFEYTEKAYEYVISNYQLSANNYNGLISGY